MSAYVPSFNYMGLNSLKDKNLIVVSFDADQGEMDTFLGMDCIYTDNYNGTKRIDYGAKFNSVATVKISVIKRNGGDFTVSEVRDFLKWTTGVRKNSYLDFVVEDKIQCSFLGRVTNAYQQKLDARTVGLAIEFTSVSPWAYSPIQHISCYIGQELFVDDDGVVSKVEEEKLLNVNSDGVLYNDMSGGGIFKVESDGTIHLDGNNNVIKIQIDNQSDDLYTYINMDTKFTNENSDFLSIYNMTLNEETVIRSMLQNEIINLSAEQFIVSDSGRVFGDTFNFIWPRLGPGINELVISGTGQGHIEMTYRYPIKIGDCAIDTYVSGGELCGGDCSYSALSVPWDNIINTPNTLEGYGITNAYNMSQINNKIENVDTAVNEQDLNTMLESTLN